MMEDLKRGASDLDAIAAELLETHQQMQVSTSALAEAAKTGKGDFVALATQAAMSSQAYDEVRERALRLMQAVKESLRVQAQRARARGVSFSDHFAERWVSRKAEDYAPEELRGEIEQFKQGIHSLTLAVEQFDVLQAQIEEALTMLQIELERLKRLKAVSQDAIDQAELVRRRFVDLREVSEPLLGDIHALILTYREQTEKELAHAISTLLRNLQDTLARLNRLNARSMEDDIALQEIQDRLDHPDEPLLEATRALLRSWQERAKAARAQLDARIAELVAEAETLRQSLHPEMPEALALDDLLAQCPALEEPALVTYRARLEVGIEDARNAGLNALQRYETLTATNSDYLFAKPSEVEQIGEAIVATAHLPSEYSGHLWKIAEDALVRILLAGFDVQSFYDRFGYPAIARALRAALEHNELMHALSVFGSGFLPSIGTESEQVAAVLCEPSIQEIFDKAAASGVFHLDLDQLAKLGPNHYRAVLNFLDHADLVGFPNRSRLQWTATLYNIILVDHELHRRVSHLLLTALLYEKHYLGLYYSLKALETHYPDLWDEPTFRPMLRHIIEHALLFGANGQRFLIDLCLSPEMMRLISGDFDSEFLIASLAHLATLRWGQTRLLTQAWVVWDQLAEQYPTLSALLKGQLQGEQFSGMATDPLELGHQLDKLFERISTLMAPQSHYGYKDGLLATQIQHWYVNEYMQSWSQQLRTKHLSSEQVKRLMGQISEQQQIGDLVEACPLQHNRFTHRDAKIQPIEGRLKDRVNNRLFELLDLFQQAVKICQQLSSQSEESTLPRDALERELSLLYERSETASWAISHLLQPELSFISEVLPHREVGKDEE